MTQNKLKWGYTYFMYKGIPKKGSEDVVSAVCYTIYNTVYLSLFVQTAGRHLQNPFCEFLCMIIYLDGLTNLEADITSIF